MLPEMLNTPVYTILIKHSLLFPLVSYMSPQLISRNSLWCPIYISQRPEEWAIFLKFVPKWCLGLVLSPSCTRLVPRVRASECHVGCCIKFHPGTSGSRYLLETFQCLLSWHPTRSCTANNLNRMKLLSYLKSLIWTSGQMELNCSTREATRILKQLVKVE